MQHLFLALFLLVGCSRTANEPNDTGSQDDTGSETGPDTSTDSDSSDTDSNLDSDSDTDSTVCTRTTWLDSDGDGFGNPSVSSEACPEGYVDNDDDCDDGVQRIHPGAPEACDGVDSNCDASIPAPELLVPDGYATIQAAVDAAVDGDRVCVKPGTYPENVALGGKRLTVEGLEGPSVTLLDTQSGNDAGFSAGGPTGTLLTGLTVTGSARTGIFIGGGVRIEDVVVRDLDSVTAEGNGIYLSGGNPVLRRVRVSGITKERDGIFGVGINVYQTAGALLENVEVLDNNAISTGEVQGALLFNEAYATVRNVVVANNHASGTYVYSAGVFQGASEVIYDNVTIAGNTAVATTQLLGIGFISVSHDAVNMVNVTSTGNTATGSGTHAGGLAFGTGPAPVVTYSNASGNSGTDWSGGPTSGADHNLSVTPGFLDTTGDSAAGWNLHLSVGSLLRDVGDPSILDYDTSRSDIGAYGGPLGDSW